ncbi:MAG TPA: tripartite tricarboxylate transporter substrate binding protein [Hyphomicrobiaceae bacterium]|nr:tripartite tricarboxylate transporter substrate binding protein [Hyphomicrobiaceae bacterium]
MTKDVAWTALAVGSGRARIVTIAAASALLCASAALEEAGGQDKFPSKPIEVVTHAGVGGGTDITARMMMVHAPGVFNTEFVVVNRTGGSGAAALQYAVGQPRDGHTILLITQTHLLTIMRGKAPVQYDDLVPLARATDDPQILMVAKQSPFKSAKDWLEAGKSKAIRYGITQVASVDHIAVVRVAEEAKHQKPNLVPFKGGGDVVVNLVGGNIEAALLNYAEAESQLKAGDVRALAIFADKRLAALPDVPTGKEIGLKGIHSTVRGFVTLKGVPEDRVKALEEGLVKAMNGQLFQSYLQTSGQSLDSVTGAKAWKAQLDDFMTEGKKALESLGLLK